MNERRAIWYVAGGLDELTALEREVVQGSIREGLAHELPGRHSEGEKIDLVTFFEFRNPDAAPPE